MTAWADMTTGWAVLIGCYMGSSIYLLWSMYGELIRIRKGVR